MPPHFISGLASAPRALVARAVGLLPRAARLMYHSCRQAEATHRLWLGDGRTRQGISSFATLKRRLHRLFQGLFESLWARLFRARCLRSHRMPKIETPRASPDSARRVLVVAPHPDDESAGCAGTLLEHRRIGDRVVIACVTDGRRSGALGLAPEQMAAARFREMRIAAEFFDSQLEWWGLPEMEWEEHQLSDLLEPLIARMNPDLAYVPSCIDYHPEHLRIARVLAQSLFRLAPALQLRLYPVQVPLMPSPANVLVPIRDASSVEQAIRCHRTQIGSLVPTLRRRRYAAALAGLPGLAEAFWELDAREYARLHGRLSSIQPSTFRGLRYWAFSDPLSYLKGMGLRRRLAEAYARTAPLRGPR